MALSQTKENYGARSAREGKGRAALSLFFSILPGITGVVGLHRGDFHLHLVFQV